MQIKNGRGGRLFAPLDVPTPPRRPRLLQRGRTKKMSCIFHLSLSSLAVPLALKISFPSVGTVCLLCQDVAALHIYPLASGTLHANAESARKMSSVKTGQMDVSFDHLLPFTPPSAQR